jgi:hypothetical protein
MFKNISLQPGVGTRVQVKVEGALTAKERPAGIPQESREAQAKSVKLLEARRDVLSAQMQSDRQIIYQLGQEYGGVKAMEGRQKLRLQRVADLLSRLTAVQAERINLEARIWLLGRTKKKPVSPANLVQLRQDIINRDPAVLALVPTISQLEQEIIVAKQTLSPMHPELRSKSENLEALKAHLEDLKQEAGRAFDRRATKEAADADNKQLALLRNELEQQKAVEKSLEAEIAKKDTETVAIGRIQELQDRLTSAKERYDAVVGRIQYLEIQRNRSGNK